MPVDVGRLAPLARPPLPGGRWGLGAVILSALLAFFWLSGVFTGPRTLGPAAGPALFFSVIIAYVIPMYGYITERTSAAFAGLVNELEADGERARLWHTQIRYKPWRWLVIVLSIGIAAGIAHNLLLYRSAHVLWQEARTSATERALIIGTELTWIVVTFVVAGLLHNATRLNQAARCCRVNLLDTARLRPFATVAVLSTLAVIGAQAAFPLLFFDSGGNVDPAAYIPGLLGTGLPMIFMAAMPIWPVHRRIEAAKKAALDALNARIARLPAPDPNDPATLQALNPLLAFRREIIEVSEWPFDTGVVTRLGFYLIIPPLTWVGAALIEHVVESML